MKPQIVVYTDSPGYFADLPIVAEELDNFIIDYWKGEPQYDGYLKWRVIEDFFNTYNGNMLFVGSYYLWHEEAIMVLNTEKFSTNLVLRQLGPLNQINHTGFKHISQQLAKARSVAGSAVPQIADDVMIYDTEIIGITGQSAHMVPRIIQCMESIYSMSHEEVARKLASSVVLGQQGAVTTMDAFVDTATNKTVTDAILEEFFWLNLDLPLAHQLMRAEAVERQLVTQPGVFHTNVFKRMRDLILT